MKKIAIIGAGWVGVSAALELRKKGYEVTLFEKHKDIFCGVSGTYGIRLHAGPHYPRSESTRQSCQRGLADFQETYPELLSKHSHSIYGLGIKDVDGNDPKVNPQTFESVCKEIEGCVEINPKEWGYADLFNAFDLAEPSAAIGPWLRDTFRKYLEDAGVKVVCNHPIEKVEKDDVGQFHLNGDPECFEHVVNATYYQDVLPTQPLPANVEAVYQPCLTLRYREKNASTAPFSFTVMDGRFVCLMPREDIKPTADPRRREYTLYHAKYTILETFNTPQEANEFLANLTKDKQAFEAFIEEWRPQWEADIKRFYPGFEERFDFVGTDTGIAAKLKTETDFRTAVTFKNEENGIIYVFSGKVNNILDAAEEIAQLIVTNQDNLVYEDGYSYLKDGEFARSRKEIMQKPKELNNCTFNLHTINEVKGLSPPDPKKIPVNIPTIFD